MKSYFGTPESSKSQLRKFQLNYSPVFKVQSTQKIHFAGQLWMIHSYPFVRSDYCFDPIKYAKFGRLGNDEYTQVLNGQNLPTFGSFGW